MQNNNLNTSCWKSNENSTGPVEKNYTCPVCYGETQGVKSKTIEYFVLDGFVDEVENNKYHICLNENCDVVYFDLNKELIFNKDDMRIPIWFKKDANPKYICYCNKAREQEIIDAMIYKNAMNMKDIIRITGAMKNGECETKNPLGKCCGSVIQEIIDKHIE